MNIGSPMRPESEGSLLSPLNLAPKEASSKLAQKRLLAANARGRCQAGSTVSFFFTRRLWAREEGREWSKKSCTGWCAFSRRAQIQQGSLHYTPEGKWWFPFISVEKAMFQMGKMYLLRSSEESNPMPFPAGEQPWLVYCPLHTNRSGMRQPNPAPTFSTFQDAWRRSACGRIRL